jgi:hypothetical protein
VKKLSCCLLALAAAVAISPVAKADSIGFSVDTPAGTVTATVKPLTVIVPNTLYEGESFSLTQALWTSVTITVSSKNRPADDFLISGTFSIGQITGGGSTGVYVPAGSSSVFSATYADSGIVFVTSTSSYCLGNTVDGVHNVCLYGDANDGAYTASPGDSASGYAGGFSGQFETLYVAPLILAALGDKEPTYPVTTEDGYSTTGNKVSLTPNANTPTVLADAGKLYTAGIENLVVPDIHPIPEPSSLVLLGTGLLGAAFLVFRRGRATRNGPTT